MNMPKRTPPYRVTAPLSWALATVVGVTTLTAYAPQAQAEDVSPTGKGISGGALLGGEVVVITEALAGAHPGWAYILGGGLGMVGGGVGGYFVEQSSPNGQGDVYMLAGGLALVIPALVLTLNATRYRPSENATEDHPPADTPAADPGTLPAPPKSTAPAPAPTPPAPTSLLDVRAVGVASDGFRVGVPLPTVRSMYSMKEQAELGLPQRTEVRVPVLAVTF